jgi:hypothetical protein
VHVFDLNATVPTLSFLHALPEIPSITRRFGRNRVRTQIGIASTMDVSENGDHFLVFAHNAQCIYHLTKTSVRLLEESCRGHINSFSFLGNDSVVCFMKDSTEYRLYNLRTRDFVRSFHFAVVPRFSLMGCRGIWSIGPSMSVFGQSAACVSTH